MKKFKSVLVFLLSLIIVFSAFPSTVFAKDIVVNQSFKYNIQLRDSQDRIQNLKGTSNSVPFSKGYDLPQSNLVNIVLDFDTNLYNFDDNDDVVITLQLNDRFESISSAVCHYRGSQEGGNPRGVFNPDNNTLTFNVHIYPPATNDYTFSFNLSGITSKEKYKNVPFLFELKSFKLSITSETQTFMERVKDFFSELSERLTSWFDSLFQWLKDIRDGNISFSESVKTLFSNITNSIKGFFSELGTKLSNGFTNLTNSIRDFFTNLGNNLKDWFDDVGQWFTDIGDRIGEFFTSLWNKIWYGNEKGESEYQKPVINNKFNDILETLTEYQEQLKGTISTISASADSVSAYISTGTQLVNGVINVAGAGFTALIVFGMVFVLVRKVVGR